MRRAIVNVAVGGPYPDRQDKLRESLVDFNWDSEFIGFRNYGRGWVQHKDVPYHFKTFAMREARKSGVDLALWCDASLQAIKDPQPIFDHINQYGYIIWHANHHFGQWCSDKVLEQLGYDRDQAMEMALGMGGCFGLDFRTEVGNAILDTMHEHAQQGVFNGAWRNDNGQVSSDQRVRGHRHDQCSLAAIIDRMNLTIQRTPYLFTYDGDQNETTCLIATGRS